MKNLTLLMLIAPSLAFAQIHVESHYHISTNYYEIKASSVRIALSMLQIKQQTAPSFAYTTLSYYVARESDANCDSTGKHYYFNAKVTMPKFEGPFRTNEYWISFERSVAEHENKHVEIAKQFFVKKVKETGQMAKIKDELAATAKIEKQHDDAQKKLDKDDGQRFNLIYNGLYSKFEGGAAVAAAKTISGLQDASEMVRKMGGVEGAKGLALGALLNEQGLDFSKQKEFLTSGQQQINAQVKRLREGLATGRLTGPDAEGAVVALNQIKRLGSLSAATTLGVLQNVTIDEKGTKLIESPSRGGSGM